MIYLKYIFETAITSLKFSLNIGQSPLVGWIKFLFSGALAYFLPVREVVHLILILVLADAFLSITELYVNRRKKCKFKLNCMLMIIPNWISGIESDGLNKTVAKAVFYTMSIMLLFYFEKVAVSFLSDDLWLIKAFILIMGGAELISCFRHMGNITGVRMFLKLAEFMGKKVDNETGINIEDENKQERN